MSGPLTGYRVIEIAGIGPGPFCAMLLADMGAEVHPRRPGPERPRAGARRRRPQDVSLRGRRSIALDLKHPDGVATLLDLVAEADAHHRGLPPRRDGAPRHRPRRVPGPQPEARVRPHDRLGPGRVRTPRGPATTSTTSRWPAAWPTSAAQGEAPVPPLNLVGDFGGGGMFLAFGVVCGLLEAQQSGEGQVVDAAMVDGTAILMSMFWAYVADRRVRREPARRRTCSTPAPTSTTRTSAPTASTSRSARSSRSSTPSCCASPGCPTTRSSPSRWTSRSGRP